MGTTTTTTGARIKGGSFLIESRSPDEIFTPEDLSDQHKLIAQTATEFVEREIVPRVKEIEEKKPGLLRELLKKAADVGLCAIDVSAKYGGLELDKISSIIVAEKMARNGSWAVTLGSQAGIGILPIAFFGTEEQKMKYVPKLASGEWVGAYALSEASSASDALNVKTGDGSVDTRVLPGSKMVSSWTIRTGDGSVDLVLPSDFQTNIDASTGDGHISLGIPVTVEGTFSNSQVHGKMNGGGQPLTIHTGDGSIRLSKS